MHDLFTFTTRDTWGRPVRHFDWTAFSIALMGACIGTGLLASIPLFSTSAKLAHRLVLSF